MEALLCLFLLMSDESLYNHEQDQKTHDVLCIAGRTKTSSMNDSLFADLQKENSALKIKNVQLKKEIRAHEKTKQEIMRFLALVEEKNGEKQCPFLCKMKELYK